MTHFEQSIIFIVTYVGMQGVRVCILSLLFCQLCLKVNFHILNDLAFLCLLLCWDTQNIINSNQSGHLWVQIEQLSDF